MIRKAIIPAAGYGTRCLPITKVVPKELFPIGTKPAIQYIVEEAISAGVEEILIVVSRSKNMIADYFDRSLELEAFLTENKKEHLLEKIQVPKVQIHYTRQPYAGGLGDAVRLGKSFVGDEPFAVLLPDEVILGGQDAGLKQMLNVYKQKNASILGLYQVEDHMLSSYGVIKPEQMEEEIIKISSVMEKPKANPPSNYAVIGRYLFNPSIFKHLENTTPDGSGEVQLTDAINAMLSNENYYGVEIKGKRYDISKIEEYIAAQQQTLGTGGQV